MVQMKAYGQSKTANIWMANEIERRYGAQGLHALSLHPGVIKTDLGRHVDKQKLEAMYDQLKPFQKTVPQGCATTVWAAISPELEGKGGLYLESCHVAERAADGAQPGGEEPGYAEHAYSPQSESRLWALSERLVGVQA